MGTILPFHVDTATTTAKPRGSARPPPSPHSPSPKPHRRRARPRHLLPSRSTVQSQPLLTGKKATSIPPPLWPAKTGLTSPTTHTHHRSSSLKENNTTAGVQVSGKSRFTAAPICKPSFSCAHLRHRPREGLGTTKCGQMDSKLPTTPLPYPPPPRASVCMIRLPSLQLPGVCLPPRCCYQGTHQSFCSV